VTVADDVDALAEAVQRLVVGRPPALERAAFSRHSAQFTWMRTTEQLVALWSSIVGGGR
jgi:glycosyltransferase involved in cell wall biosynthesis